MLERLQRQLPQRALARPARRSRRAAAGSPRSQPRHAIGHRHAHRAHGQQPCRIEPALSPASAVDGGLVEKRRAHGDELGHDQHRQRHHHAAFHPGFVLGPEVGHDLLDRAQGRAALRLFDGGIVTGLRVVGRRSGTGRTTARGLWVVVSAGMRAFWLALPLPMRRGGPLPVRRGRRAPRAPRPRAAGRAVGRSGPERSGRGRGCSLGFPGRSAHRRCRHRNSPPRSPTA
jgi:hypothetical protein